MIVDHQTHWHSPSVLTAAMATRSYPRAVRDGDAVLIEAAPGDVSRVPAAVFDIDYHFASLADNGVDAMISSPVFFAGFTGMDEEQAADTADLLNEENARMQAAHPERFVGLAVAPMQHPATAVEVLGRAAARGLRGVCVLSNYDGESPTSPEQAVVYATMAELGMVCVLHPAQFSIVRRASTHDTVERGLNWMHDTAYTALSLIATGILDECPRLTVLHPHLGGVLPFVSGRVARLSQHDLVRLLRERFYVDTASKTAGALRFAVDLYGLDRVVFASDDPWGPRPQALAYVRSELGDESSRLFDNVVPGLEPAGR